MLLESAIWSRRTSIYKMENATASEVGDNSSKCPAQLAAEVAAKEKAEKLAIRAEIQRLKKAGILLGREERKIFPGDICPVGEGFLLSWVHLVPAHTEWRQFKPPWGKPKPTALPMPSSWYPRFLGRARSANRDIDGQN